MERGPCKVGATSGWGMRFLLTLDFRSALVLFVIVLANSDCLGRSRETLLTLALSPTNSHVNYVTKGVSSEEEWGRGDWRGCSVDLD